MCLILLHFQPCAGSEPDCNCCCLSNKCIYMQLWSPEVTRVNFHLTPSTMVKWNRTISGVGLGKISPGLFVPNRPITTTAQTYSMAVLILSHNTITSQIA